MPTPVGFFSPADVLGLGGYNVIQRVSAVVDMRRSSAVRDNGDEANFKTFAGKLSVLAVYDYEYESGNISLLSAGAVSRGYHVDVAKLEYRPNAWPRLSYTLHKHASNNHSSCYSFAPTPTFPAQFGIPRSLNVWNMGAADTTIGLRAMIYTITCKHMDEEGEDGSQLVGENNDGIEVLEIELTGVPASLSIASGWVAMQNGIDRAAVSVDRQVLRYERHRTRS